MFKRLEREQASSTRRLLFLEKSHLDSFLDKRIFVDQFLKVVDE